MNSNNNNTTIYNKKKIRPVYGGFTCTNCGKRNHDYKHCDRPVTSWGIILVDAGCFNINLLDNNSEKYDLSTVNPPDINVGSIDDRIVVGNAFNNIRFLMISRKHSLGYIEFVRGRYKPHMVDQTLYLFKQMRQDEIKRIEQSQEPEKGFDYLWNDMWGDRAKSQYLAHEYQESRNNYETLRYIGRNSPDIGLDFIVRNVHPEYTTEEWGFPKGRRNKTETELECAVREFKEETGYTDDDFKIIDQIAPLEEEFTGTNGIKYRHIYYVAHLISGKEPQNNLTEQQRNEIGNIAFFDFQNALEYIRDYHMDRKQIVRNLFMFYLGNVIKNKNINTNNTNGISNIISSAK